MLKNILSGLNKYWFVGIFFLFCCYASYGALTAGDEELSGMVVNEQEVVCEINSVMDGTYQTYLNSLFEDYFPGRKLLINVRNQVLYSVFNESPNANVVIGKDRCLYEPVYITNELKIDQPATQEHFKELGDKLIRLQAELNGNGKELYIFITPSKAHFYKGQIPLRYQFLGNDVGQNTSDYIEFVKMLQEKELYFFDAVDYIKSNEGKYQAPVFYKSGIHWSYVWGESAAVEFLDYINTNSRWELDTLEMKEKMCEAPIYPDTDLYESLNLFTEPDEEWYTTEIKKVKEGKDKPNVFLRGCSFMGQSLNMLIKQGVFNKDIHLENYYYFTDRYSNAGAMSNSNAYDEMNIDMYVGQADILILEVNYAGTAAFSMGLIDYLLEHPEYMDNVY